jgi:hypothetical protein
MIMRKEEGEGLEEQGEEEDRERSAILFVLSFLFMHSAETRMRAAAEDWRRE